MIKFVIKIILLILLLKLLVFVYHLDISTLIDVVINHNYGNSYTTIIGIIAVSLGVLIFGYLYKRYKGIDIHKINLFDSLKADGVISLRTSDSIDGARVYNRMVAFFFLSAFNLFGPAFVWGMGHPGSLYFKVSLGLFLIFPMVIVINTIYSLLVMLVKGNTR